MESDGDLATVSKEWDRSELAGTVFSEQKLCPKNFLGFGGKTCESFGYKNPYNALKLNMSPLSLSLSLSLSKKKKLNFSLMMRAI